MEVEQTGSLKTAQNLTIYAIIRRLTWNEPGKVPTLRILLTKWYIKAGLSAKVKTKLSDDCSYLKEVELPLPCKSSAGGVRITYYAR
jgi:hypothetical protein